MLHPESKSSTFNHRYFVDVANPNSQCSGDRVADSMGRCYLTANRNNKYTVHGALTGGPKTPTDAGSQTRIPYSNTGWNDWRLDWVASEVAVDYNAGYTMALAAVMDLPAEFWTTGCTGVCSLNAVNDCIYLHMGRLMSQGGKILMSLTTNVPMLQKI